MHSLFRFAYVGLQNRVHKFVPLFNVQSAGFKLSSKLLDNIPEKPKKPPTSFLLYLQDIRPALEKENPNLSITDIAKIASKQWKEADERTKETYVARYEESKQNYVALNGIYLEYLEDHEDVAAFIKEKTISKVDKKKKRNLKKLYKLTGKPTKPPTPFGLYLSERLHTRGDAKLQEWIKDLAAEWRNLPVPERESYGKKSASLHSAYRNNLIQWFQNVQNSTDEAAILLKEQLNRVKVVKAVSRVRKSKKANAEHKDNTSEQSNMPRIKKKSKKATANDQNDTSEKQLNAPNVKKKSQKSKKVSTDQQDGSQNQLNVSDGEKSQKSENVSAKDQNDNFEKPL